MFLVLYYVDNSCGYNRQSLDNLSPVEQMKTIQNLDRDEYRLYDLSLMARSMGEFVEDFNDDEIDSGAMWSAIINVDYWFTA